MMKSMMRAVGRRLPKTTTRVASVVHLQQQHHHQQQQLLLNSRSLPFTIAPFQQQQQQQRAFTSMIENTISKTSDSAASVNAHRPPHVSEQAWNQLRQELYAFNMAVRENAPDFRNDATLLQALSAKWTECCFDSLVQSEQARPTHMRPATNMIVRFHEHLVRSLSFQKRYHAAKQVVAKLRDHQVMPTLFSYTCLLQNCALELLQNPRHLALATASQSNWPHWRKTAHAIAKSEDAPAVYYMSWRERRVFHAKLLEEMRVWLDDYVAACRENDVPFVPILFNKALWVGARNRLPHQATQALLQTMIALKIRPDVGTFQSLVRCARGDHILDPLTQYRNLVNEQVLERTDEHARWFRTKAHNSLVNWISEQLRDGNFDDHKADQARELYHKLNQLLDDPVFHYDLEHTSLEQLTKVYKLQLTAAGLVEFKPAVLQLVDSYLDLARNIMLSSAQEDHHDKSLRQAQYAEMIQSVLFQSLEAVAALPVRMMVITPEELEQEKSLLIKSPEDVQSLAQSKKELDNVLAKASLLANQQIPELIKLHQNTTQKYTQKKLAKSIELKLEELQEITDVKADLQSQVHKLQLQQKRMALQSVVNRTFTSMDDFVQQVLVRMRHHAVDDNDTVDPSQDPQVLDALLRNYLVAVTRYNALSRKQRYDWPFFRVNLRERVMALVNQKLLQFNRLDLNQLDQTSQQKVRRETADFVSRAALTCLSVGEINYAEFLFPTKQELLQNTNWELRDYEQLVHAMTRPRQLDMRKAFKTLQYMHNRAIKPSASILGNLVGGQLNYIRQKEADATTKVQGGGRSHAEASDQHWTVGDVVTFVETWYNMVQTAPSSKAVVTLLEELFKRNETFELQRLLGLLKLMELDSKSVAVGTWIRKYHAETNGFGTTSATEASVQEQLK